MWLAWIFGVDQYIIQIYYNKDIHFFSQNLVNIFLEDSRRIRKAKKHDLVFDVAISGSENGLKFINFVNSHPMIGISEIQLGESFCLTKPI